MGFEGCGGKIQRGGLDGWGVEVEVNFNLHIPIIIPPTPPTPLKLQCPSFTAALRPLSVISEATRAMQLARQESLACFRKWLKKTQKKGKNNP